MSQRRATLRAASAGLAVASVFFLATCDLATLTKPNEGGTPGNPFDSTELVLGITGITVINNEATIPLLGTAAMSVTSSPSSSISLANVVKRYYSATPSVISVDSITGIMTGLQRANAVKVTAKILAPELGAGVTISRQVRVRFKGIKVVTPLAWPLDSITGLGVTRTATYQGTNNQDALVAGAITLDSLRLRSAGVLDTSSIRINANTLTAKKNGTAYLVAFFDGLRDSVLVKVRQVAKSITFPTTDYTARHVNFNLTVPFTVKDVADSTITAPTATWSTKNVANATIGATTGILQMKSTTSDTVFVTVDTVTRKQRLVVSQVIGSLQKTFGDNRSDTVAKNVTVVPTVTAVDSGSTLIQGVMVQFKVGNGFNASVNDTVPIATNAQGRAAPTSWKIGDHVGTNNNTLIATSGGQSATFTVSGVAGAPKRLAFVVQPTSATTSASIAPAIQVQIQDSLGNPIPTATNTVTLTLSNNPGAATLGGVTAVAAVAGIATFNNVTLNATGSGYVLQAASGALQVGFSNGFDVFGPKTKLAFTTQPAAGSEGGIMPTVRVTIQDAGNNRVTSATDSVQLSIVANPGPSTLSGTTKVAAVAGVATFSNFVMSKAASGYTLGAAATGLANATSNTFNVTAVGAASKLAFSVQPSNVVSGAAIAPSFTVQVQDINGALVTTSNAQVTLSIDPATNPTGLATLSGITTVAASSGVASFSNVIVNRAGTGYKLIATVSGITPATSNAFNVTPGNATKLSFFQGPTHTVVSTTMSPGVVVEVQDANNNRVTSGVVAVTLTMSGCGTLTGGGSVNSVNGIATYSTLSASATGTSCSLSATATPAGLTGVGSSFFNIVAAGGATRLKFTTQPASSTAGIALNAGTVAVQDAAGNTVGSASTFVSISVASGPSTSFSGSNGLTAAPTATFSSNTFNTAGSYTLVATATSYRPDTSTVFVISAAAANRTGVIVAPATIVAGVPFPQTIQAAVQDQFGNTVTSANNNITIATSPGALLNTGSQTATAQAVNGVATFNNLSVRKAGTNYSLCTQFQSGLNSTCHNKTFDVVAGPVAALGFLQQPTNVTSGANFTQTVSVQGQDSVGNNLTDFTSPVTVALSGGTAGAVLSGTKTVNAVAGIATFNGLTIDKAGTLYQLNATSSGLTTALSNTFNVNFGAANKLAWVTQPASTTFPNAPLGASGTTTQLAVQDANGNTVTNDNRQVTFTVTAGPSTTFKVNNSNTTSGNLSVGSGILNFTSAGQVSFITPGVGYVLNAAATGLTPAATSAFTVGAFDVKDKLFWNNEPSQGSYRIALPGQSGSAPSVVVQDKWNNQVTNATDSIAVSIANDANPTTTLVGGGATAATGGALSFPTLLLNKAGNNFTLRATATGLKPDTTIQFNITTPGQVMQCCTGYHYTRLGNTIYYTQSSSLRSVSVFGGTVTTITGSTNASQITNDGTNVYWAERGSNNNGDAFIRKYNVATTAITTLTTGQVSLTPWGDAEQIFSDGTNVYFASSGTGGYAIKSVSVNASSAVPTEIVTSLGSQPYFRLSGSNIYYRDANTQVIKRVPSAGGVPTTLTTGTVAPDRFALIGTTLFFSDGVNIKSIANAPSAGSAVAPTTVLTAPGTVYDINTDGTSLYVNFNGSLRRYATSDFTTFVELSSNMGTWYYNIFFDATDVFFYTNNFGAIGKVPK